MDERTLCVHADVDGEAQVVRRWRDYAQPLRLPEREVRKLTPAFEHASLHDALRGGTRN